MADLSEQERALAALRKLVDVPWQLGDVNGTGPQIHFYGHYANGYSPAESEMIGHLHAVAGLDCRAGLLADQTGILGIVEGYDLKKLEAQAAREETRKSRGPELAALLQEITGVDWRWDGVRAVTTLSREDLRLNQADDFLGWKLKTLSKRGIIKKDMGFVDDWQQAHDQVIVYSDDGLKQAMVEEQQRREQGPHAAALLSALTDTECEWKHDRIVVQFPPENASHFRLEEKLRKLQDAGAVTNENDPVNPRGGRAFFEFDLQRLQEAASTSKVEAKWANIAGRQTGAKTLRS